MRRIDWLAVTAALLLTLMRANAQADSIEVVEAEGIKHLIHYDAGTDTYRDAAGAMLAGAIPAYTEMWTGAIVPPVIIDTIPAPAFEPIGDPLGGLHARRQATATVPFEMADDAPVDVCYVAVYSDLAFPPEDFAFELAREIAQCFLFYNVPAASTLEFEFVSGHDWWGEGGSLWMAYSVYGSIAPDMDKAQRTLTSHMGESLVKQGEGAFYFWAYAAETLGIADTITLMAGMPDDANEHMPYLDDHLPPDADSFMHGYALALAKDILPAAPPSEDLYRAEAVDALPGRVKPAAEPFGIDLVRANVSILEDDEGLSLDTTQLTPSGLTVSLEDGTALTETEAVELCPTDGKVFVVASRALKGDTGEPPPPANVKLDVTECDDEDTPADTGEHTGAVPTCVVGTWLLIEIPYTGAMEDVTMGGVLLLTVDAAGNTVTTYEDFTQSITMENLSGAPGNMMLTVNGTATGKVTIDEEGFVVDTGELSLGLTAVASIGGMSMDFTDLVQSVAVFGASLPNDAQVTCLGESQLRLLVSAGEFAGEFVFTRA